MKKWCEVNLALPLTEENTKKVLDKALSYCTIPKHTKVPVIFGQTSSWREIAKLVEKEGIKPNSKVFLAATDWSGQNPKRGERRKIFYCWNNGTNSWEVKRDGELCN